jgi:hypothetical protein
MEDLETTVEEPKSNKIETLANGYSFLFHSVVGMWGELQQDKAAAGQIDYETWMGHLSDFSAPAALVSLVYFMGLKGKSIPITCASAYTLIEITSGLYSGIEKIDPLDIACYFLGAGVAYGTHKLFENK